MRRWFREWALIDLVTFGVGVALIVGFAAYGRYIFQPESGWYDLWPNIATEVIGVWLSVRFIDALIRRRETYHGVRRTIVGNLNYMVRTAQSVLPAFYQWSIRDLGNEVSWFIEKLPKRKRYLTETEIGLVQRAATKSKYIYEEAERYANLALLKINRHSIDSVFEYANNRRKPVLDHLNSLISSLDRGYVAEPSEDKKSKFMVKLDDLHHMVMESKESFSLDELSQIDEIMTELETNYGTKRKGDSDRELYTRVTFLNKS